MSEELDAIKRELGELLRAMQSGAAMLITYDPTETTLRVGVNSAMVDSGALAGLLLAKGIISELEYFTALRDAMKREVESYTKLIRERLGGAEVTLR